MAAQLPTSHQWLLWSWNLEGFTLPKLGKLALSGGLVGERERGVRANLPCLMQHPPPRLQLPPALSRCRAQPGPGMLAELLAELLPPGKTPVIPLR